MQIKNYKSRITINIKIKTLIHKEEGDGAEKREKRTKFLSAYVYTALILPYPQRLLFT